MSRYYISEKKTNQTQKSILLGIGLICLLMTDAMALKPYFNSYGYLVIKAEANEGRMYTGYWSIVGGVESWLSKYFWTINQYCLWNDNDTYYANLPNYGYTQVTSQKLANMILYDQSLGLSRVPVSVVNKIAEALQTDHDVCKTNHVLSVSADYVWDPYYDWKWRSAYMEGRYAENNSTVQINANCWGTADYLAKDNEWVHKYQADFPNGAPDDARKFPHIYLDGGKYYPGGYYNAHCIDDDLSNPDRATFLGTGTGVVPRSTVNSFDVIRLANTPKTPSWNYEMIVNTVNTGENVHCIAYLMTDYNGQAWYYEKHNYGNTRSCPYGVNILGNDQWTYPVGSVGAYNNSFRSYFRKYGDNKGNLATSNEQNWAGVKP